MKALDYFKALMKSPEQRTEEQVKKVIAEGSIDIKKVNALEAAKLAGEAIAKSGFSAREVAQAMEEFGRTLGRVDRRPDFDYSYASGEGGNAGGISVGEGGAGFVEVTSFGDTFKQFVPVGDMTTGMLYASSAYIETGISRRNEVRSKKIEEKKPQKLQEPEIGVITKKRKLIY